MESLPGLKEYLISCESTDLELFTFDIFNMYRIPKVLFISVTT